MMSTRSSFKRIAAVAVAGLAFVGLTALPAKATGTPVNLIAATTGLTAAGTAVSQVAGPANFVTVSDTVVTGGGALPVYFTLSGGTTTTSTTSGTIPVGGSVQILTPTVGTITLTGYTVTNGAATTTATDTIVITVVGSAPGTTYASSQVYGAPGTFAPNISTDSIFSVTSPAGTSNAANFSVAELDANGVAIIPADAKVITVTVTNGLISSPNLLASPIGNTTYITGIPTTSVSNFYLSGIPNFGGTATVTFAVGGVVLKTYSVKFVAQATRIVLTALNPVIAVGNATTLYPTSAAPIGITANTNALEAQEFDSNGNVETINPSNISIVAATPGIAAKSYLDIGGTFPLGGAPGGTPTSTTALGVSLNGIAVGTTNFTAIDSGLSLTSIPVSVRVSSGVPTSVVIASDSSSYNIGQAGQLTTTLSDAAGILPAGTYAVFTGQAIASIALSNGSAQLPGAPATVAGPPAQKIGQVTIGSNGTYVDSFNAPVNAGQVTISATPVSNTISVTPASFSVIGTDAATDAQVESLDSSSALAAATTLATASGDTAEGAGVSAAALATSTQTQITALTGVVTAVLAKADSLAKSVAAINKRIGKK